MLLCYDLSMPGRNSWNGKWTGEGRPYLIVRSYRGKAREESMRAVLENQPYFYRWDDGWCARVGVRLIDGREAARLRRKSAGFAAYDWMVDSLEQRGYITTRPASKGAMITWRRCRG